MAWWNILLYYLINSLSFVSDNQLYQLFKAFFNFDLNFIISALSNSFIFFESALIVGVINSFARLFN